METETNLAPEMVGNQPEGHKSLKSAKSFMLFCKFPIAIKIIGCFFIGTVIPCSYMSYKNIYPDKNEVSIITDFIRYRADLVALKRFYSVLNEEFSTVENSIPDLEKRLKADPELRKKFKDGVRSQTDSGLSVLELEAKLPFIEYAVQLGADGRRQSRLLWAGGAAISFLAGLVCICTLYIINLHNNGRNYKI